MEQYSRPHPSALQKLIQLKAEEKIIQSKIKEEEQKLMQSRVNEEKLIQATVRQEKLMQSKVKEEKLMQSKVKEEDKLPQNKEHTPLCQIPSETYHDCIITVKPKPNLKRKWTPAPPKSIKPTDRN